MTAPPLKTDPKYGYFPWWPEDGDDWVHPEDVATARSMIPSPRIWRRDGERGPYVVLHYGDTTIRVKRTLWREAPYEGTDLGDWVEVRARGMTNEPHIGQVRDMHWDDATYTGDAYATYAWACHVAAIEVDLLTAETRVLDFTAVQEVGRVLNPTLAAGQVEGGVAQGVGWALLENVAWENGRMKNPTLTDYVIPTAPDTPPIRVVFLERPHARAPHGAKGIGELPMDGPAPALVT